MSYGGEKLPCKVVKIDDIDIDIDILADGHGEPRLRE